MKNLNNIFLADFTGGAVVWIISIVLALAIIIILILNAKRKRKNKQGMVHNKPKKNDHPENLK